MARHPYGPQARRRARNRTYTVLALLVVVLVIAFMYGPFGADADDENKPLDSNDTADFNAAVAEFPDVPEAPDMNEAIAFELPEPEESTTIAQLEEITMPEPQPATTELSMPEPTTPEPNTPQVISEGESFSPEIAAEGGSIGTIAANPEADVLIAKAAGLIAQGTGGVIEARDSLNEALRMPMGPKQRDYVKSQLSELSNLWLFSRTILPGDPLCTSYRVMPGDILESIGKDHKVPYEILMDINRISNPRALQAGRSYKVVNGPFHAKVYRSTFTMDIYLQNTYVCSYKVGLGKSGTPTPTGLWRLRPGGKAYATSWRDPDTGRLYQPEDPDYPLGSRWMALDGLSGEAKDREGFGIHGTKEPDQIGTAGSRGCIRMYNGEAIKVYNMLIEGLSTVEVID